MAGENSLLDLPPKRFKNVENRVPCLVNWLFTTYDSAEHPSQDKLSEYAHPWGQLFN